MTDVPGLHQSYRLGSEQIMGHSVEVTKALESQSGESSISPEKPEQSFPCSSSSCRNVEPSDDKDADLAGPSIGTHIILKGNHDGSDAPECGLQNVREAATPHQKERTLPPLPPNDMALALQEAKLRWQIQYYAAMHKFYSMQLQQGAMDPSEEPEDRLLPRASFHDILCEGVAVDEDPMQMSMEELLAQSTSVFEETGAPHQYNA
ncbi:hypothetical protein TGVAND_246640 [Toxoplasma gondii VAND]|uniref:Uncharacterized protein n=9 Tax=Toxoplasma gondii TaxID=5811 RepID=A0A086QIJ2_TOXGO|nr:hypothetical protein TGVAND_246640 [Toxoplasma gondii VAND]